MTEKIDSAGDKKDNKDIWYQFIYVFTFLIFFLELVSFNNPKFVIVDLLTLVDLLILTYFLSKIKGRESWIMPHSGVITALWLMIFLTSVVRSTIWY